MKLSIVEGDSRMSVGAISGWIKQTAKRAFISVSIVTVGASSLAVMAPLFFSQTAYAAGIDITNVTQLRDAIENQADGQTWTIESGTYGLTPFTDITAEGQTGWYFPITANNITINGVGNPTIYGTSYTANGAWATQNFMTIFGNGVTVNGVTLMPKVEPNKTIEVLGSDATIENTLIEPNTLTDQSEYNNLSDPTEQDWGGSIYYNGAGGTQTLDNVTINNGGVSYHAAAAGVHLIFTNVALDYSTNTDWINSYRYSNHFDNPTGSTLSGAPQVTYHVSDALNNFDDVLINAKGGDTIDIAAGAYTEQVVASEDLTFTGAGAGSTFIKASSSLSSDSFGKKNVVEVNNGATVTMSGVTVEGPGPSTCGSIDTGIAVLGGATLNLSNSIVTGLRDNPVSGCQNGEAIRIGTPRYSSTPSTGFATINNVTVSDYQKNGIVVAGTGSNATIQNSSVTGLGSTSVIAQNGIEVAYGASATVTGNTVSDNFCTVDSPGDDCTADPIASPSTSDSSAGILLYQAGTAELSSNTLTDNQSGIWSIASTSLNIHDNTISGTSDRLGVSIYDTDGYATPAATIATITGNTISHMQYGMLFFDTAANGADLSISAPSNTLSSNITPIWTNVGLQSTSNNQPVTLPTTTSGGNTQAVLPSNADLDMTSDTVGGQVQVVIPAGTTITGPSGWDGVINPPTATSVTLPLVSGYTLTPAVAIEVGSNTVGLTFDNAVRLVFPGQAGKHAGFARGGVFTEITSTCSGDTQTDGNALPAAGNCKIDVGSDLVVWTKHFTAFVTYSQTAVPSSSSSSTASTAAQKSTATTASATSTSTPSNEVLGNNTGNPQTLSTNTQKTTAAAAISKGGKLLGLMWYWWIPIVVAVLAVSWFARTRMSNTSGGDS